MVWGCFTAQGIGNFVRIHDTLNAALYVDILKEDFLGTFEWYGLEKDDIVFQHDNDPKHTARVTTEWLDNKNIEVLEWPPQSPDLNPIENLWAWFKFRLSDYDSPPSSVHELWERAQDIWNRFTEEECTRLIDSMPKRIAAVIKAKGDYTGF